MAASKYQRIAGWVLSVAISAFLLGASVVPKFTEWEGKAKMFADLGFTVELMYKIGVLEAVLALALLVPRCSFLAAVLLTGYFGGATVTHLRVGQASFWVPVLMGVAAWIAVALRQPEIFSLAFGARRPASEDG